LIRDISNDLKCKERRIEQVFLGPKLGYNNPTFPSNGLRAFSQKITTLTSLYASNIYDLNDHHVAQLSLFFVDLVSIHLYKCSNLTELSLFSLVRNCPSLSEIKMEHTNIGEESTKDNASMMDIGVYSQLKSLYLGDNLWLRVEKIIKIASSFPNLQLLDLNQCDGITEGIWQVLRICCKLRHFNLDGCSNVNIFEMNFVVPKLEVLDLSNTEVNDETLNAISKSCSGLLELSLEYCYHITEKGVKDLVENCKQLREIHLGDVQISYKTRKFASRQGCICYYHL
jgi:F-box and leucine-rich repeat protein 2/20